MKALYDLTPFTLLDFPDIPAAILWFAGCNLRCTYCYNPDIVLGTAKIDEETALSFLTKRQGLLEGVVLSGGEATLYPNLVPFCRSIKALGYKIKLDTNAMRPDVIQVLLDESLLDYVALDYKAPSSEMSRICGGGSESRFWESFRLLQRYAVDFEVRTTYHPDLLSEAHIISMAENLLQEGYTRPFYVQLFRDGVPTLGTLPSSRHLIDYPLLERYVTLRN
ncbi:anaerobic ribonucleoside-triphosphate reductase activating protein [Sulfuricurvum sp.]|uniref:anaerobic ribonucleoside-triphosphate reductase activating protein n=1 Tax=Sulfuricurvum sp. TaxID=2025608 RepID=UPI002610EEF9|nr:anaerobic ribonucleoside-triphosphate reductase activating protein [Sulfuricurvum sp.]MDD2266802.1 anaerobic ribonucleoside-triphosphate reductase activating protein [Sulfuricurvum sp.]MDD2784824.1 anaerobic ribonucleoside-triphosphate reductase activating protein [Sulfuricurvum sp.]